MRKLTLTLGLVIATTFSFAQKGNITNAAMAYKDMQENIQGGDLEKAAKDGAEAKKYIDLAAAHADTKGDPKMYMYKGKIYIEVAALAGKSESPMLEEIDKKATMMEGFSSLKASKAADKKKRYIADVDDYAKAFYGQFMNMGIQLYDKGNYEDAMVSLMGAEQFSGVLDRTDSVAIFYSGLAAYNAKDYKTAAKQLKKSMDIGYNPGESLQYLIPSMKENGAEMPEIEKIITGAQATYPNDLNVMIQAINLYIDTDRKDEAAAALQAAIDLDPENVALLYTSGNIYEEMGRADAAEIAFVKAVELDPKNVDALYPTGVHYFNRGADRNNEANKMELGDPNYEPYLAEADEYFKKSLGFLERAAEVAPNDVDILESLKLVYGKLKMMDKYKETKAKIETLK